MDLAIGGKTALVTGAGRGIGRAIALRLAAEGAAIVVNDTRDAEGARTVEDIKAGGGDAMLALADVSDEAAVARMFQTIEAWRGPPDIVVNNAGIVSRKAIVDVDHEEWERVLAVNLDGTFLCSQAAARALVAAGRPGRIVNISSIHGRVIKAGMGSYCASKAAIEAFSKQLAVELAPSGIGVNVVACGAIRTEINMPLYQSTDPKDRPLQQALMRRIPMGGVGEPEDIANAVAFLCSPVAARYVTGVVLYVDGGYQADGTARI